MHVTIWLVCFFCPFCGGAVWVGWKILPSSGKCTSLLYLDIWEIFLKIYLLGAIADEGNERMGFIFFLFPFGHFLFLWFYTSIELPHLHTQLGAVSLLLLFLVEEKSNISSLPISPCPCPWAGRCWKTHPPEIWHFSLPGDGWMPPSQEKGESGPKKIFSENGYCWTQVFNRLVL